MSQKDIGFDQISNQISAADFSHIAETMLTQTERIVVLWVTENAINSVLLLFNKESKIFNELFNKPATLENEDNAPPAWPSVGWDNLLSHSCDKKQIYLNKKPSACTRFTLLAQFHNLSFRPLFSHCLAVENYLCNSYPPKTKRLCGHYCPIPLTHIV